MKLPRFLQVVLFLDLIFVVAVAAGGARGKSSPPTAAETEPAAPSSESLSALGRELAGRSAELERRETQVRELIRGQEVLRRSGLLDESAAGKDARAVSEPAAVSADRSNAAFDSLKKAYAAMEPDSAAQALAALAERDREAVVEMLISWNPRTSGAILDALTQRDAELAADLSYAIWKRGAG